MAIRGLDLVELWQQRRWHYLWTIVLHLPRNSLTKEKLSNDEEFVEKVWREDEQQAKAIRMSEYSPEVEALYGVIDRLGDVCSTVIGANGGKPKRVRPMQRPTTAFERVRNNRRRAAHQALVARVLPPSDDT